MAKMTTTTMTYSPVNIGKHQKLNDLKLEYRIGLVRCLRQMNINFHKGEYISNFCYLKNSTKLSERYFALSYQQAYEAFSSHLSLIEKQIREYITAGVFDKKDKTKNEEIKTILYRVNVRQQWFSKKLELKWLNDPKTGKPTIPATKDNEYDVILPVDQEHLKLLRRLVKQAKKKISLPKLHRTNTLKLNSNVLTLEDSKNSFGYWLKISTLEKGHPIYIPVVKNNYLAGKREKEKISNLIQVGIFDDIIKIGSVTNRPAEKLRKKGRSIALDWGVTSLFASNEGHLYGVKMLSRLKELDKTLMEHQAFLQKRGLKLKEDARYNALWSNISSYVTNEVNRILNQLADSDIMNLIVEKLDFRFGGLSKTMNRIVTNSGRGAVKKKLARLKETHGVDNLEVNPAYTSQQCSSCDFVGKSNRKSQKLFVCVCCGLKLNADVNAARNIMKRASRFSNINSNGGSSATRKTLRACLEEVHSLKCSSGKHATAEDVGSVGEETALPASEGTEDLKFDVINDQLCHS